MPGKWPRSSGGTSQNGFGVDKASFTPSNVNPLGEAELTRSLTKY